MRTRVFGSTGRQVAVVGQGTWHMERDDRTEAVRALRRGLDLGMAHIDTAELYGAGRVEELVAEAIRDRRDEVFLVSKVKPENASRAGTLRACERSLARLRTDRLDVYLLHWPGSHPLAETIAAFEALVAAGKILAWGVSNFDAADLAEAVGIAGARRVACNQVLYHLQERGIEHSVVPYCERNGSAIVAYSPFGSGHLPRSRSRGGGVLAEIAAACGAVPRQVALAFLLRRASVFAIPKASNEAHVQENAAAAELELSAEQLARIDAAFPLGRRRHGVPVL